VEIEIDAVRNSRRRRRHGCRATGQRGNEADRQSGGEERNKAGGHVAPLRGL
jgi:hypothetical protein